MNISLKKGVRLRGMSPIMVLPIIIARDIYAAHKCPLVITSVTDGRHSVGSLHHVGDAIDLRLPTRDLPTIVAELRHALGDEFDVLAESDHIHIEYDPE